MRDVIKDKLIFFLKYIVGLLLLIWILSRVDRQSLIETFLSLRIVDLAIIILLAIINLSFQFNLWKILIESHSQHFNLKDLLPSFFAGFAFRLMIPGGHAEISKIFLLPGRKRGKAIAFGLEKGFQTFVKILLVLIAIPMVFPEYKVVLWISAIVIILAIIITPFLLKKENVQKHLEKNVSYTRIFLLSSVYTTPIFLCLVYQYFYLLNISFDISFFQISIVTVFIWGAGLIPISISGLGVRENLSVFFLAQFGIPGYTAVTISLLVFFINAIIPAVIGVFIIIRRKHDLTGAGSEIKAITKSVYQRGKTRFSDKKGNKKNSENE